jgi:hypothetical protein
MLNGKDLTMYIHRTELTPKKTPQAANCQFHKSDNQKFLFHPKGCIFIKANLRKT